MPTLNSDAKPRIAIIGAGITGLTCASLLKQRGLSVTVFEKSRGLGGRLATRRAGEGLAFDHGAQYVTARSDAFRALVQGALDGGAAAVWRPKGRGTLGDSRQDWIVGLPAMNRLVRPLAAGIDIRLKTQIVAVQREVSGWRLLTAEEPVPGHFDFIVSAVPAPQARALLPLEADLATALERVDIAPCWALMMAFPEPLDPGFDVSRVEGGELAWIARNSAKPARNNGADCWVVHAGPQWSAAHLERDPEEARDLMLAMLVERLGGALAEPLYANAHRWRYALTTTALSTAYLASADRRLFIGGDWSLGARVEFGFESGTAMAAGLTAALSA